MNSRLCHVEELVIKLIQERDERIRILEQENKDLKGQLKQWDIHKQNGAKKGLFLR